MTVKTMFDSPEFGMASEMASSSEEKVANQAEKCSLKKLDQVSNLISPLGVHEFSPGEAWGDRGLLEEAEICQLRPRELHDRLRKLHPWKCMYEARIGVEVGAISGSNFRCRACLSP